MDFFHFHIQMIHRSTGRSAVAAAAYRSGARIVNTWDGTVHDYTRKQHVVYNEVMLPANAPPHFADRSMLWNSVEWAEKKRDAQLAREVEMALPKELPRVAQIKLVRKFVQKEFVDAGMYADVAIHDKEDGNPHAHILLTVRPLNSDGSWAQKSRLVYDLDDAGQRIALPNGRWKCHKENMVDWDHRQNTEKWRKTAAETINEALREYGFSQGFVDYRSYARQNVQQIPTVHEGAQIRMMEKRGIHTAIHARNLEITLTNGQIRQLQARLARLNAWAKHEAGEQQHFSQTDAAPTLRYRLAHQVLHGTEIQNSRKRLQDSVGIMNIMAAYDIQDVASYLAAVRAVNRKYYALNSKLVENERTLHEVELRLKTWSEYEERKMLYAHYRALPARRQTAFYEKHSAELRRFEVAERQLKAWQDSGEKLSPKAWRKYRQYLDREIFMQRYGMREVKKETRQLETVQRALQKEKDNLGKDDMQVR